MADMSAVGNSATAKKKPAGKQVLTEASIRPSENGGFTVEQRYRQESNSDGPSPYIEPKTFTFESFDTMVQHLGTALGAQAKAPIEPRALADREEAVAPPPPAAQKPPMPLEESGLYSGVARG